MTQTHLFSIGRVANGELWLLDISYEGETMDGAREAFLAQHDQASVAEFIEPLLWVDQSRDGYGASLLLSDLDGKVKFKSRIARRNELGEYTEQGDVTVDQSRMNLAWAIAGAFLERANEWSLG